MGSYSYERTLYIYTVNTSRIFWVLDRPSPAAYEAGTRPGRTTYRVMTPPPDQDVKTHPYSCLAIVTGFGRREASRRA